MENESLAGDRNARRLEALAKANRQRRRLKNLRIAVKAGVIDDLALLRGELDEYEPLIAGWTIIRFLPMMRRIGPARAHEILMVARVSPNAKIRNLSYMKRGHLADLVIESRTHPGPGHTLLP